MNNNTLKNISIFAGIVGIILYLIGVQTDAYAPFILGVISVIVALIAFIGLVFTKTKDK